MAPISRWTTCNIIRVEQVFLIDEAFRSPGEAEQLLRGNFAEYYKGGLILPEFKEKKRGEKIRDKYRQTEMMRDRTLNS